jgi:hypothetical protein
MIQGMILSVRAMVEPRWMPAEPRWMPAEPWRMRAELLKMTMELPLIPVEPRFHSSRVLPGLCLDHPGLCLDRLGIFRRHPGTPGEAPTWTVAPPGWSGGHPGLLVGNNRSADGVSVTATIISSRIITVTYWGGPGFCQECDLCLNDWHICIT